MRVCCCDAVVMWCRDGFGTIFSFAAVALNMHYNAPDIIQPVRAGEKRSLRKVLVAGIAVAALFYIFIGERCTLLVLVCSCVVELSTSCCPCCFAVSGVRAGYVSARFFGCAVLRALFHVVAS